jgi:hypothetical protein
MLPGDCLWHEEIIITTTSTAEPTTSPHPHEVIVVNTNVFMMNLTWSEYLSDPSSDLYQHTENLVNQVITEILENFNGFMMMYVIGFNEVDSDGHVFRSGDMIINTDVQFYFNETVIDAEFDSYTDFIEELNTYLVNGQLVLLMNGLEFEVNTCYTYTSEQTEGSLCQEDFVSTTAYPTTIEPTTQYSTDSTESTTTQSSYVSNECEAIHPPNNGGLACDSMNSTCTMTCDTDHVPWQLKYDTDSVPTTTVCNPNSGQWTTSLTDECVTIDEICAFDVNSIQSDSKADIKIKQKTADTSKGILGGWIYNAKCDNNYVFQNTGHNQERVKCICKFKDANYLCVKSHDLTLELGSCVDPSEAVDTTTASTAAPTTTSGWMDWDDLFTTEAPPEGTIDYLLNFKRKKFTMFMRGLFDTYWYGASSDTDPFDGMGASAAQE